MPEQDDLLILSVRWGLLKYSYRWEPSLEVREWLVDGGTPDSCCATQIRQGLNEAENKTDIIAAKGGGSRAGDGWWWYSRFRLYQTSEELMLKNVDMCIPLLASAHIDGFDVGHEELRQINIRMCSLSQIIADHHLAALRVPEAEADKWITRELWRIKGLPDFQIVADWALPLELPRHE